MKIVNEIKKFSHRHVKDQKFRQTWYPLSCKHPLCTSKKLMGDGSQWTVRKQFANPVLIYANIVFANWLVNQMFANVYIALRSPLPIFTAFQKSNFPTLCIFCWIALQIFPNSHPKFEIIFGKLGRFCFPLSSFHTQVLGTLLVFSQHFQRKFPKDIKIYADFL